MAEQIPPSTQHYFEQNLATNVQPASPKPSLPKTKALKTTTAATVVLTTKMIAPKSVPVVESLENQIMIQPSYTMSRNIYNKSQNTYLKEEQINLNAAIKTKNKNVGKKGMKLVIIFLVNTQF